jgi:hypothetical protein
MGISKTTIINLAIVEVSGKLIETVTEKTKNADLAFLMYDHEVDATFELPYNWKFCRARKELSQHAETPAFGYDFQYVIPNYFRRVISMVDTVGDIIQYRHRIEALTTIGDDGTAVTEKVLLTDQAECRVRGIIFIADPTMWPGWFSELVILRIAGRMEPPLKGDQKVDYRIARKYQIALQAAIAANALEDADVDKNGINLDYGNNDVINAADPLGIVDSDERRIVR